MTLAQIALFLPAAAIVAAAPGANNLLAFANGTRAGWGLAVRGLAGRLAAFTLMVVLVALGMDAVLQSSETAFHIVKWAGVAYLLVLAVRTWRAPLDALPPTPAGRLVRREFLTAMGNPKAYLLFTAFLPQFVTGGEGVAGQLLVLGALYIAVEGMAAILWAGAGAWAGAHALSRARRRLMNRISGGLLGIGALFLARSAPG